MTLPTPNLDDRTFTQLLEKAKELIPRFSPEWTDHNTHDPGITFLELFAWVAETQQYYLNRIRDENYLKFLQLLGVRPKQASQAEVEVCFSVAGTVGEGVIIPKGTSILADEAVFETKEPLVMAAAKLIKVISSAGGGWVDHTEANSLQGLFYSAFGEEAEQGSGLYLGFSGDKPFPVSQKVSLTCNVFEDYRDAGGNPVTDGRATRKTVPSGIIEWEYFKKVKNSAGAWAPLQIIKDETGMLSRKGRLYFLAPGDWAARAIQPFPEKCSWIRATVREEGFELSPRLDSVALNTVPAVQQETFSEVFTFSGTGCRKYTFTATGLSLYGCNYVQVCDGSGFWNDWPDCKIEKNVNAGRITIHLDPGRQGGTMPKGRKNLRLVSYLPEWAGNGLIGSGSGLPHQKFTLEKIPVIPPSLVLQVGEPEQPGGQGPLLWQDWFVVEDFDASGPGDKHFVLTPESGEIVFGDGVNGAIPPASPNQETLNIRLISYRAGGGKQGNVSAGTVNRILRPVRAEGLVKVENRQPASGGISRELLEETKMRLRRSLQQGYRAVTTEDYERLACATPGIRVARAKAIPLFQTGLANYPGDSVPAVVTVVVVPFSYAARPIPSRGFMKNVFCHLNKYRLITTELDVQPPEYVVVSVGAAVVIGSRANPDNLRLKVNERLQSFLHPLSGGSDGTGWSFGRSVYKSEIFELLEKIPGVDYIKDVVLHAQGAGIVQDAEGNFTISPQSLVCSGEHEVEIIAPGQVSCRKRGI
ncbi:putative baseplate assembly protein [Phosphitispora fastidiosa]|uniref:putative baseplate assembly protein n=1 Tax=Phosphitispora fastidiosa TaxID=2837202 RepID=UPI001E31BD7F|nr:putative baseplate assembly protein [Phosphitispora fastidiosa]MBU7005766.1 hypothetical protein [Phosphitispora fastidiosa]